VRGTFEASELLYGIESIFCKAAMARSVSPMRAAHGRTSEERSAYVVGKKTGEEAALGGKLRTAAALNTIAQQYFARQGSGEPMAWKLAFEHGYENGFKKVSLRPERPIVFEC